MTWVLCLTAFASPIDLHAAVREALVDGPSFAVADAERRAALGRARTTGTWLENPEARVEQNVDELRAEMSLPIPLAGQPFARAAAGDALHDAALERGELDRAHAALSVARLYLDAERADQLARLARGSLAVAERNRDAARRLLDAREVSEVDAVTLAALAARAVRDATVAEQEALRARLALEVVLGREPTGETTTSGWPDLSIPTRPPDLPAERIAAEEARAARALGTEARMNLVPTPSVIAGWQDLDVEAGPILGVEVEVPLFAPGVGAVRSANAEADRATAEARRAQLASEGAWVAATGELAAAETAFEASRLDGLEPALEAIGAALESGEYSLAEYNARRDALVEGLTTTIEARHRVEMARVALWELAGEIPPELLP